MAKPKANRTLNSYKIKSTNETIRPGDCVVMRPASPSKPPYVAKVLGFEVNPRREVMVKVLWYYRPEDSEGGRQKFHGIKEVFLSDHEDKQSAATIESKCTVHSFKDYTKLDPVGNEDFFCRFEYKHASGSFVPDRVAVFCKCELPYNPDELMIQCEVCKDWFHPACVDMDVEEANKIEHFFCQSCSTENGKKTENSRNSSRKLETKVAEFRLSRAVSFR